MNSRESRLPLDDLGARIRQSLRTAYGGKYPARDMRRQLLDRAAEQRRALRRQAMPPVGGLEHSHSGKTLESVLNHLDYIRFMSALGFFGMTYVIR